MTLPVICLAGPTGSGKTAMALKLAEYLDGEIVNADSRQVYAHISIVTAQPTREEQARIRHHLYGFLPCSVKISAGQWLEMVKKACAEITARGKLPIFVGGTGFYFEALLHGLAPMPDVPPRISAQIAGRMTTEGPEALYAELVKIDAVYAAKVHPHDRQRVQRALEIHAASGKTFSWWHAQGRLPALASGPLLVLRSDLSELEPRLASRIELMLATGALEEAAAAQKIYGTGKIPAFNGIGMPELLAYLAGSISLDECRALWLASTRAYAKRQLTWFRGRREAVWIEADSPEVVAEKARILLHGCNSNGGTA